MLLRCATGMMTRPMGLAAGLVFVTGIAAGVALGACRPKDSQPVRGGSAAAGAGEGGGPCNTPVGARARVRRTATSE